ncbi:MAG: hypothetical protein ABI261_09600, partial [Ginsengibacter sp.]
QNSTINVSANFDNTLRQVMHIENWKNWFPAIQEAYKKNPDDYKIKKDSSQKIDTIVFPGKNFIIHALSPMSYEVSERDGSEENNFAFTVFPGGNSHKMDIFLVNKTPFIYTLFSKKRPGEDAMIALRSYLEDPKQYYGFNIQMAEIRDPVIASLLSRIKKEDLFIRIQSAHKELIDYLTSNGLVKTGHVSISYINLMGDSIQLTVGIPVNKIAASAKGIQCLSLPPKGRVLVGNYEGKFSYRDGIYHAMTKYLTDHTLSIPAESFERYLNDSIPTSDSSDIRIELDYPVY